MLPTRLMRRSMLPARCMKRSLHKLERSGLPLHAVFPISRGLCVSRSNLGAQIIYKSQYPDVDIPKTSFINYIRTKTQGFDDRIALVSAESGTQYRYAEMWQQVDTLASAFTRMGVGKNSTLALISPNCPEFVFIFLGAVATGATVTTVNCLYTADEIASQLDDSGSEFVACHVGFLETVQKAVSKAKTPVKRLIVTHKGPTSTTEVVDVPTLLQDDGTAFPTDVQIDPLEDVLVLPYSSGTTGRPKGVMLTHHNLVANLQQVHSKDIFTLKSEDDHTVLAVLPMFHIYGMVPCLMLSLLVGSRIVTFHKFDPQLYVSALEKYKPTVLFTVPPIINFLVHAPQVTPEMFECVQYITCGAAPLGETLPHKMKEKFSKRDFILQEGYGMTELSPVTHLTPGAGFVPGSCGQLIPNTQAKLVDVETKEEVSSNKGELCIRGPQVMKGYLNNDEATASTIDKSGWLYTGDVAKIDPKTKDFFIVDRVKELIKVKGFQVAPAELEDLLRTLPGVKDSAVIGVPDEKSGELPRAFVVKDPKTGLTGECVEDFVAAKVSAHKKLSGGVVFVDAIPKSMTGKILRKDLKGMAINK